MKRLISILLIFTNYFVFSQNKQIRSTPTIMIWGEKYRILKPKFDNLNDYLLQGNGFLIDDSLDYFLVKPTFDGEYDSLKLHYHYLDIIKVSEKDSILVERRFFEMIHRPKLELKWGGYDNNSLISIKYNELQKFKDIELNNSWVTEFSEPKIINAYVETSLSDNKYDVINRKISEDFFIHEIVYDTIIKVKFSIKYSTKPGSIGILTKEFDTYIMSPEEAFKFENPYLELYQNKHVEQIATWNILDYDTLEFNNRGEDLYFHLLGIGTEDEFSLRSVDTDFELRYNTLKDEVILIDVRKLYGKFKLSFWGDSGRGEVTLIIKR